MPDQSDPKNSSTTSQPLPRKRRRDRVEIPVAAAKVGVAANQTSDLDPLMQFRTAWLRGIAKLWLEDDKALDDDKYLANCAGNAIGAFIPKEWDGLKFFIQPEDHFLWVGDAWTWIEEAGRDQGGQTIEDELKIALPLTANIPPKEQAVALAEYYLARPSIFTKKSVSPDLGTMSLSSVSMAKALIESFPPQQGLGLGQNLFAKLHLSPQGTAPHGLIPSHSDFQALMVALIGALAKSWANANFCRRLLEDSPVMLRSTRDYVLPWKLNFKVVNDPNPTWKGKEWDWTGELKNELTLCLPERPLYETEQAVALAAYNATGAEYPLTCCP